MREAERETDALREAERVKERERVAEREAERERVTERETDCAAAGAQRTRASAMRSQLAAAHRSAGRARIWALGGALKQGGAPEEVGPGLRRCGEARMKAPWQMCRGGKRACCAAHE